MIYDPDLVELKEAIENPASFDVPAYQDIIKQLIHYYEVTCDKLYRLPPDNVPNSVFYNLQGQTWEEYAMWNYNARMAAISLLDSEEETEEFENEELYEKLTEHLNYVDELEKKNLTLSKKNIQ